MSKIYYEKLIDRVFNVLYVYENEPKAFNEYIKSLCFELSGNEGRYEIQQVRFRLNALTVNEVNHSDVRKTTLKCINIISKILESFEG